ncbi:MAG: hypothetical protein JOZ62_23185 [Acidobacteriaceae bacterium]|nr:hypothetical protein [Acidobacteriaceae bacterium]
MRQSMCARLAIGLLVLCRALFCFDPQSLSPNSEQVVLDLRQKELDVQRQAYALQAKRLELEERAFKADQSDKQMTLYVEIALLVALLVGTPSALLLHRWHQRRDQQLRLKLKAAEIALNSPYGGQIKSRAKAIAALFPNELPGFANFTARDFTMYSAPERILELLKLIAANPQNRKDILESYSLLFPRDLEDNGELINKLVEQAR